MEQASQAAIATNKEWDNFSKSPWAAAFYFWKALDPKHADDVPTVEAAMELIMAAAKEDEESLAELKAALDLVQQDRDLKNSAGRSVTPAHAPTTANHSVMGGQPSINTLLTDSDGIETL
jgi:predicted Zn-dependent protease